MNEADTARQCSMCHAAIVTSCSYLRCSVSSCNAGRLKLRFCSTACFAAHIPTARHKNAAAIEMAPAGAAP